MTRDTGTYTSPQLGTAYPTYVSDTLGTPTDAYLSIGRTRRKSTQV